MYGSRCHPSLAAIALCCLALGITAPPSSASENQAAERADRERARSQALQEAERAATRGADAARRSSQLAKEAERARDELRDSQRELADAASRVAELSARVANEDLRRALREGALSRPVFGLVLSPDDAGGVRISAVSPSGPASEAGLQPLDRLTRIGDRDIDAPQAQARVEQATQLLRRNAEGTPAKLHVVRDGHPLEISVTPRALTHLAALRADAARQGDQAAARERWAHELARVATPMTGFRIEGHGPLALCAEDGRCMADALLASQRWNGLRLFPLNPELGRYFKRDRGVLVLESGKDHPLRPGDVLIAVEGRSVETSTDVMRQLRVDGGESGVELLVLRDGREKRYRVPSVELDLAPSLRGLLPPPAAPMPPSPPLPPAPARTPDAGGGAETGANRADASVLGRALGR